MVRGLTRDEWTDASRYWPDGQLYPALLSTDADITLRLGPLRLLPPDVRGASTDEEDGPWKTL
jgi:hypothetical protein